MDFKFIGWMHDPVENHDKVWGVIFLEGDYGERRWGYTNTNVLTFWGRRGKKLQTKLTKDDFTLMKLVDSKRNKGYIEVDKNKLNLVYPEFQTDLEKTAIWATLKM